MDTTQHSIHDEPPRSDDTRALGPGLRRSRTRRMVAGVAGGIAERLDVDVNIVRVAFVVLTCVWGLGAAVYLAMWALVPSSGDPVSDGTATDEVAHRSPVLVALLLAGALSIGLIFSVPWWGGPRWGGGIGLSWLVLLAILLVLSLRRPIGRLSFGRVLAVLALVAVSLVIVTTGAFFGLVALTGVPLSGGVGNRIVEPTGIAPSRVVYRTAVGAMTVDLRQLTFPVGTVHVTASVAVGKLTVEVPTDVVVSVAAHSGVGNVVYVNGSQQSFLGSTAGTGRGRRLVLVADAGVGEVALLRGSASADLS